MRDTDQEDEENQVKGTWEASDPGRSIKAQVAREKILLLMRKKKGEALSLDEEGFLKQPREIRLSCPNNTMTLSTEGKQKDIIKEKADTKTGTNKALINIKSKKEKGEKGDKANNEVKPEDEVKFTTILGYNYPPKKPNFNSLGLLNSFHPSKSINNFMKYCKQDRTYTNNTSLTDRNFISNYIS